MFKTEAYRLAKLKLRGMHRGIVLGWDRERAAFGKRADTIGLEQLADALHANLVARTSKPDFMLAA